MKILIADDEEAPREQLKAALKRHWPQAKLVAACEHGVDAWDSFLEHEPDACFLDIRMPGLSGIEVAQRIAATQQACAVVFCTAYNDQATQAFDSGAVDYLLKPLDDARFLQAVERIKSRAFSAMALPAQVLALAAKPHSPRLRTLQASVGKEIRLIPIDSVVYFESDTRYTRVVYGQRTDDGDKDAEALIRTPLKELLVGLDPEQFWQIHRSTIVNTQHMHSALRVDENNMLLCLRGRAERLAVSRHFQGLFKGS